MSLFRKLRDTFRSRRMDAELDDEFQFHLEQRVEHLVAQGASPEEARREAARLFGNRTHLRESTRDRNVLPALQAVLQDLRFAMRNMRRNPAFAAAAVLSLALGIGANTALFSVLDGLLLRLLPVEDPQSLVVLRDTASDRFAYPGYELLRAHSRLLSGVAAIQFLPGTLDIVDHGRTLQIAMQAVSSNYFQMLGASAARGRTFAAGELHVAVISDRYWRAHYNASPDAIGDRFQRFEWEYTVIGIAPPGFHGVMLDTPADIFIPLEDWVPTEEPFRSHGRIVSLVARMRPGVTPPQVAAEAGALLHRVIHVEDGGTGISALRKRIARPLLTLDFLVAFVLLIACSNLASLALASTAARQREMAVRQAIGAGRSRLVCQLLTESALLAMAGGTLALLVAQWISGSLLLFLPPNIAKIVPNLSFRPDAHVLGFTAALTLATCLLFGLAPALQATRSAPLAGLRQTPGAGHTSAGWVRRGLVVCEVGLCTAVLMSAGLFVRTLHNLQSLDPALAPEQIVTANIPIVREMSNSQRVQAFDTLSARASAVNGARAAGYIHVRPLTGQGLNTNVLLPGSSEYLDTLTEKISPGLLAALGIPLASGRDFNARDDSNSTPVAIVNEQFARRYLPSQSMIGRRIRIAGDFHDLEIVGVVKDTHWLSLRDAPSPMLYRPFGQDPASFATLVVRTSGDPAALAAALQSISREMRPPLPIDDIVPFRELENRALFTERMIAQVSAGFGALALLIACAGLYGLLSYGVVRRPGKSVSAWPWGHRAAACNGWCCANRRCCSQWELRWACRPPSLPAASPRRYYSASLPPIPAPPPRHWQL